jgi:tetratricopeptide (TPR) repeat protein
MTKAFAVAHRLSPDRWRTLEPLIDGAIATPPEERERFFDDACHGDRALRAELESMVEECLRADPALDHPAIERFAALFDERPIDIATESTVLGGRFRLEREIGRGGMGSVYLAHDLKHGREVALKMVRPELASIVSGERFLAEIQVTATLRHPHILPLFDSGEADGCIYFVMPYIEGGTLRDRLMRDGTLPRAEALRIASQVADGLAAAHHHGIVHRDIKPENILLAADGRHAYITDFGVALALSHAEREPTGSWLRVGTLAYMSPEQLDGSGGIDIRTDIYSLGCVLHEMLVGKPPARRSSPQHDRRKFRVVDRYRVEYRRWFGGALDKLIDRMLAESPDDRLQTVTELRHALAVVADDRRAARVKRRAIGVAATVLVASGLTIAGRSSAMRERIRALLAADVDPDLTVVLPFRTDSSGLSVLSGDNTARLLYDALGRWKDLKLGDPMGAVEAGRLKGAPPVSVNEAREVARSLGAGRFVWGDVSDQRGVTRISAQLYDDRTPTRPISHVVYLSAEDGASRRIEELADSLVAKLVESPAASSGTSGTRTFAALKRYAEGYAALRDWNTELAERDFRGALDLDPHFAQAWLGLAQAMAWSGTHRSAEWLESSANALVDSTALSRRDRALARGLLALAQGRMAEACDIYRGLIARNTRDFAAHFGLGDCLSTDRVVVPDPASPTGWRFRGSLHTAIEEYRAALELIPSYQEGSSGQTFARLTNRILFTDPGDYRRGFALAPDTIWMGAFPEIDGDTLAFHPRPRPSFMTEARPATQRDALARNRELLRSLMTRWVRTFPRSGTAWAHYAVALESIGELDTLDQTRRAPGALGAIANARRLTGEDSLTVDRYVMMQVRILLRLRRFDAAAAAVDSLLAARRLPTAAEANVLAPLAALTGRARLLARLLASAAADSANEMFTDPLLGERPLPQPVVTAAAMFTAYAALASPADSLSALVERLDSAIRRSVGPTDRDAVRASALLPAVFQAQPTLGASLITGLRGTNARLASWHALTRGDTAAVRATIARDVARMRSSETVPAPDAALQGALLALAARDTAHAIAILDRVAAALPELGNRLTVEILPAAALPRVLWLRAMLEQRTTSQTNARAEWAATRALWLHADPELRSAADSVSQSQGSRSTSGRK